MIESNDQCDKNVRKNSTTTLLGALTGAAAAAPT